MKNTIRAIAAAALIGAALPLAAPATAQPGVISCSPAPCKVRGDVWGNTVKAINGGAWEKIWPGKPSADQPKKGPWEKAFENAPMP